jgi:hypothetical protein
MSGKPFNLEAARRGEPVVYVGHGAMAEARFYGESAGDRYFIVERSLGGGAWNLIYAEAHELRMAPKKKVWYCRHYVDRHGSPQLYKSREPVAYDPDGDWHGEPFTIEVEE